MTKDVTALVVKHDREGVASVKRAACGSGQVESAARADVEEWIKLDSNLDSEISELDTRQTALKLEGITEKTCSKEREYEYDQERIEVAITTSTPKNGDGQTDVAVMARDGEDAPDAPKSQEQDPVSLKLSLGDIEKDALTKAKSQNGADQGEGGSVQNEVVEQTIDKSEDTEKYDAIEYTHKMLECIPI